jgi:mono/diheme cytochrome c family protein
MRRPCAAIAAIALLAGPVHAADYVAMSGKELHLRFCASCHGGGGRGDGPVASSFAVEVPDLTLLARRYGGEFPRDRVARIIDGRYIIGSHGSRTMPVWGEDLSRIEMGDPEAERATEIIITRLADYLWTLQRKQAPARIPRIEALKSKANSIQVQWTRCCSPAPGWKQRAFDPRRCN